MEERNFEKDRENLEREEEEGEELSPRMKLKLEGSSSSFRERREENKSLEVLVKAENSKGSK